MYQFQSQSHYTVGEICSTKLKLDLSWTKMIYSTYPESNQKKVLWSTGNYIFLLIKRMPTKIKVKAYAFNSLIRLFAILLCIPRYLSYVIQCQWLIAWIGTTKYLYICICIHFIGITEVPCRVQCTKLRNDSFFSGGGEKHGQEKGCRGPVESPLGKILGF